MLVTVTDDHDHDDDSDDDEHLFSDRAGPNRARLQRHVPQHALTHVPLDATHKLSARGCAPEAAPHATSRTEMLPAQLMFPRVAHGTPEAVSLATV